jgi:yersiniabactin salicyl-AMP ligase
MNIQVKEQLEAFYSANVWEPITLGAALEKWSVDYKDAIAVVDGDRTLTYEALNREAVKLACGFLNKGYNKGDRIVLQLPSSLDFIRISFALFKIGVVPVMALPAQRSNEISGILKNSRAKGYLIADAYLGFDYRKMAREVLATLENKPSVIVVGNCAEFEPFDDYESQPSYPFDAVIDYRDVGLLMLSGGTTGVPKLIPRRHTDYLYVAKKSGERCGLNRESVYLVALPAAHNFPFGCPGIMGTLYYGGKVVICPTTSPDEILSLIDDEKATITGMVPAIAGMCVEYLETDDEYDISSLEVLQVGGSVLDASLAEKISEGFNCKLQQVFGTAEGLICGTALIDSDEVIYNTQGKPISEYDEILIVDENNKEVPDGDFGELIVRGPYTIYGYEAADDVNAQCITEDCYYRTGDKARKRADGNYQIVGRLKEMINRAGEKIMPSEIEELLARHPLIKEVQVTGIPDSSLGERICAFILKGTPPLSLMDVRQYLTEKSVAAYKLPDDVVYVASWPLTNVGKIDKTALKNMRSEDDIR